MGGAVSKLSLSGIHSHQKRHIAAKSIGPPKNILLFCERILTDGWKWIVDSEYQEGKSGMLRIVRQFTKRILVSPLIDYKSMHNKPLRGCLEMKI